MGRKRKLYLQCSACDRPGHQGRTIAEIRDGAISVVVKFDLRGLGGPTGSFPRRAAEIKSSDDDWRVRCWCGRVWIFTRSEISAAYQPALDTGHRKLVD